MRVMVLIKATEQSEAGEMPSQELLEQMTAFNEDLVRAGVMLAGDGLHPSSKGVRVEFSGTERRVIDGPFAETKELLAGYWVWQVRSMEEAIEWVKRIPNPTGEQGVVEVGHPDLALTAAGLNPSFFRASAAFSASPWVA